MHILSHSSKFRLQNLVKENTVRVKYTVMHGIFHQYYALLALLALFISVYGHNSMEIA